MKILRYSALLLCLLMFCIIELPGAAKPAEINVTKLKEILLQRKEFVTLKNDDKLVKADAVKNKMEADLQAMFKKKDKPVEITIPENSPLVLFSNTGNYMFFAIEGIPRTELTFITTYNQKDYFDSDSPEKIVEIIQDKTTNEMYSGKVMITNWIINESTQLGGIEYGAYTSVTVYCKFVAIKPMGKKAPAVLDIEKLSKGVELYRDVIKKRYTDNTEVLAKKTELEGSAVFWEFAGLGVVTLPSERALTIRYINDEKTYISMDLNGLDSEFLDFNWNCSSGQGEKYAVGQSINPIFTVESWRIFEYNGKYTFNVYIDIKTR